MKFLLIVGSIIYFIICYIFFLKKWYEFIAINKVYIPDYISSEELFVNDTPLRILKRRRNTIIILIILIISLTALFFSRITFYLTLGSIVLSLLTSIFTFNARIYDFGIFSKFSNYLVKNQENSWEDHLEKNFSTRGTTTKFSDIISK